MNGAPSAVFDEMLDEHGQVRPAYRGYLSWLDEQDQTWLRKQGAKAESVFRRTGITFNVYGQAAGEERLIPFDMIPRII
ncbi:MAG: circularly permuted type 2 ATP-grasp protein, partial [Novosphingobium sp.]|nr:circularly permuted type 2 ATP-grasp protein [Novosphingobium sp.]